LSQTPKRPGTKDISELKARLGLKKGGPAPTTKSTSTGGGVVPPPGVVVPAPPGARAPQPSQPIVPSASEDPFGAMNAMAHQGAIARAPEIVIVNDGKPVESVSSGERAAGIAKLALIAVIPLALGVIVGQIAKDAEFYNGGIRDSKLILADVKNVKRGLVELQRGLEDAQKKGFRTDKKLTTDLEANTKLALNAEQVFRAKQNAMNPDLAGQILSFYSGVTELRSQITSHVGQAKADDSALTLATKASADGAPSADNPLLASATKYRYGVVLSNPAEDRTGGAFGAQIVELGPPFCGDGKQSSSGTCSDAVTGFGYRTSPGDIWTKGEIAKAQPGQAIPAKQVVRILPGGIVDSLIQGGEASTAELMYKRRLEGLYAKVDELIKLANSVETKLNAKANEGERFTFFL
jgi:hypothetical protein